MKWVHHHSFVKVSGSKIKYFKTNIYHLYPSISFQLLKNTHVCGFIIKIKLRKKINLPKKKNTFFGLGEVRKKWRKKKKQQNDTNSHDWLIQFIFDGYVYFFDFFFALLVKCGKQHTLTFCLFLPFHQLCCNNCSLRSAHINEIKLMPEKKCNSIIITLCVCVCTFVCIYNVFEHEILCLYPIEEILLFSFFFYMFDIHCIGIID